MLKQREWINKLKCKLGFHRWSLRREDIRHAISYSDEVYPICIKCGKVRKQRVDFYQAGIEYYKID